MLKKAAVVAATTAGLMLAGAPAFADDGVRDGDDNHQSAPVGLLNVQDVLNEPNIGICDWSVNVIAVSAQDVLNDWALSLPLLAPGSPSEAEATSADLCAAPTDSDDDQTGPTVNTDKG